MTTTSAGPADDPRRGRGDLGGAALAELRAGRARRPGAGGVRGGRAALRPADQAGLPERRRRAAVVRGGGRVVVAPGWPAPRRSAGTCAPTRCARCVARARTPGWWSTSCCTSPTDATGPGSRWAAQAAVGDRLVTMAPRRGMPYGGIEFEPGTARELLLVADETAVPAVCSILEDLDPHVAAPRSSRCRSPRDVTALAGQAAPATSRWSGCPGTGRRSAPCSTRGGTSPPGRP